MSKVYNYSTDADLLIMPLGNLNLGSEDCDMDRAKEIRDTIMHNKSMGCVLMGDICDKSLVGSKADIYEAMHNPKSVFCDVIEYLRPLVQRNRVLAAVEGDHEERLRRMCGGSPMALVLGELGAGKLLSESSALLNITSGDNKYTIYATHGTGVSRTLGGCANWLERTASIVPHADVIMAAHMGTPMILRQDILKINKDKGGNASERHSRLLVSCGSCLACDDDYYHDDSNSLPSSKDYPIISIIPGTAKPTATI